MPLDVCQSKLLPQLLLLVLFPYSELCCTPVLRTSLSCAEPRGFTLTGQLLGYVIIKFLLNWKSLWTSFAAVVRQRCVTRTS